MKNVVIFFIFIRHGINPFKPIEKIADKMTARLSGKEKDYIIKSAKDNTVREVLTGILNMKIIDIT